MKHQELRKLEALEKKAWNAKMHGSDVEASTVYGQEGSLELVWRGAADSCRAYREEHGLLGLSWKEISAR